MNLLLLTLLISVHSAPLVRASPFRHGRHARLAGGYEYGEYGGEQQLIAPPPPSGGLTFPTSLPVAWPPSWPHALYPAAGVDDANDDGGRPPMGLMGWSSSWYSSLSGGRPYRPTGYPYELDARAPIPAAAWPRIRLASADATADDTLAHTKPSITNTNDYNDGIQLGTKGTPQQQLHQPYLLPYQQFSSVAANAIDAAADADGAADDATADIKSLISSSQSSLRWPARPQFWQPLDAVDAGPKRDAPPYSPITIFTPAMTSMPISPDVSQLHVAW